MWMVRLLASGKVAETVLVLGITETEENVMLLEGSGVTWKVVISTWEAPVPVHRPARFNFCPISPGHHIAFEGATQKQNLTLKTGFTNHFVDDVWTAREVGWCACVLAWQG